MSRYWKLGVDIGGTFTDIVANNEQSGEVRSAKVPSRSDDPIEGLVAGIGAVGLEWDEVSDLTHGTTMVTNDIVENKFARIALIATKGFSDTIEIGRVNRRYLYDLASVPKITPLVPAELRFEVDERVNHKGEIVRPLTGQEIDRIVKEIADAKVDAVAVCLIHAYKNTAHEAALLKPLLEVVPFVSLSHRVNPEAREYERTNTTALSAASTPRVRNYLGQIAERKPESSALHFFHSSGGMASPEVIGEHPLLLAMSGPAAGVTAAAHVAQTLGIEHALTFDMGGTTTDVCLISKGKAEISANRSLGDRRIRFPMVAVESIGAGGGSIAKLDKGILTVGPESAGANPGPACYDRGGKDVTVSDANMILGYLNPEGTLGGDIVLSREAAAKAFEPIATETGVSVEEAALGLLRVATANMTRALRRVTVERGVDGRACTLIAFGGAGPMHAADLARAFQIKNIIVPRFSSGFSALGCVTAKMSYSVQRTVNISSMEWRNEAVADICDEVFENLADAIQKSGHDTHGLKPVYVASLRYRGQSDEVPIHSPMLDDCNRLGEQFRAEHEKLFGFSTDEPWEFTSLRAELAVDDEKHIDLKSAEKGDGSASVKTRTCWFENHSAVETPCYDRDSLGLVDKTEGSAIIEDEWSTIVVPPTASFKVDEFGHIHIEVEL